MESSNDYFKTNLNLEYIYVQIEHYQKMISFLSNNNYSILKKKSNYNEERIKYYEDKILDLCIQLEEELDSLYGSSLIC